MPAQRGFTTYRKDAMGVGLTVLNKVAGWPILDKLGVRGHTERAVFEATRTGFKAVAAANRTFSRVQSTGKAQRPASARGMDLFDLTPTEDQQMMVGVVTEFAAEVLRPAAADCNETCATPDEVLARSGELGLTLMGLPEALGGLAEERSATTGVLVGEALAHGDMGMALACLAPASVATALGLWGDASQQGTYLPSFTGEQVPAAALAVQEPRAVFDPLDVRTTAARVGDDFVLNGTKSLVVRGNEAELFVVAAYLEGTGPALFLVESGSQGLQIESEPSMGLRAAGLTRLELLDVRLPQAALLGGGDPEVYREMVRLSRLAWCGLALGTSQAVLDYVIPYVKERKAFGEPVAYRQGVAFMVSDIGIELEGMRLVTYKAAARVDRGQDFAREVALARRLTGEYGMKVGTDGVQLLGGHGFVKEHPVERWYRDLRAVGLVEGALLV